MSYDKYNASFQDEGQTERSLSETAGGKIKLPAVAVCVMIGILMHVVMLFATDSSQTDWNFSPVSRAIWILSFSIQIFLLGYWISYIYSIDDLA